MGLLSENDYKALDNAIKRRKEIVLEHTLGNTSLMAKTLRVGPPWDVPIILQVRVVKGGFFWVQNFASIEEAKRYVNE